MSLAATGRSERRRQRHKRRLWLAGIGATLAAMLAILLALLLLSQSPPPLPAQVGPVSFELPGEWIAIENKPGVFSDRTQLSIIEVQVINVAPSPDLKGMLVSGELLLADEAQPVSYELGSGVRMEAINGSLLVVALSFTFDDANKALVVNLSGDVAAGRAVLDQLLTSAALVEAFAE